MECLILKKMGSPMTELITDTKACGNCGGVLPLDQFYFRSDRNSYTSKCKACFHAYQKQYKSNPDNVARQRSRRAAWQKKVAERTREQLGDAYIKKLLSQKTGISQRVLTPELVDLKRTYLQIKRFVETLK